MSSSDTIATVWVVSEALQGVGIAARWFTDIIVVHHTVTLDLHTIQLEGYICTCGCIGDRIGPLRAELQFALWTQIVAHAHI